MKINLSNLDLTKELLTVINDEIEAHPKYYARLGSKLLVILKKYQKIIGNEIKTLDK